MSSRSSGSSSSSRASKFTDDEIHNLILKLLPLLPQLNLRRKGTTVAAASEVLKETCNYIMKLQSEVDDLSERLSQLLDSMDSNGDDGLLLLLRNSLQH